MKTLLHLNQDLSNIYNLQLQQVKQKISSCHPKLKGSEWFKTQVRKQDILIAEIEGLRLDLQGLEGRGE